MRDQPQGWSDRHEPVMEEVPAQRPPAEDQPAGTGPDGAWAPPTERVAATMPGAWMPAGAPAQMAAAAQPDHDPEGRAAEDADRPVGDADRPAEEDRTAAGDRAVSEDGAADNDRAADDDTAADGDRVVAEDRAAADDRAAGEDERAVGVASVPGDRAARDEAAQDESARDEHDEAVRDHEVEQDAALHDAAHGGAEQTRPAGGVPDDAVSRDDAPVPAAAYDTTDTTSATGTTSATDTTDVADSAEAGGATEAGDKSELMPGDVPDEPASALFEPGAAESFRDRWQRVQMQFVDDPRSAAEQARALVDDVFASLHQALTNQRGALDNWQSGQSGDTEQLRVAVRRYRDFLDRMLGL